MIRGSFEKMEQFKHLGNSIQEEIKNSLRSGNACYHSVQNLLSSSLLFKNIKFKIYNTIILSVVWYGCETWSLTMSGGHILEIFENRALRRIFGPMRDEVTVEWRKLHNEEQSDLYCSPNIIQVIKMRRMKWAGHVARRMEKRGAYRVLVGKSAGKSHLEDPGLDGRIILRWIFSKWGCGDMDWIDLAQDRDKWWALANVVRNFWVLQNMGNFLTS